MYYLHFKKKKKKQRKNKHILHMEKVYRDLELDYDGKEKKEAKENLFFI